MAKRRGYRKIILVDISGIGFNRRPKTDGTQTVYIKNSIDMGNAFDFDPEFTSQFWQLGYLDTLRTFGRLNGYKYFIHPNDEAEKEWQTQLTDDDLQTLKRHVPDEMRHERNFYLVLLEVCALFLGVPRIKAYTYEELTDVILDKVNNIETSVGELVEERALDVKPSSSQIFDAFVKEIIESKKRNDHPYFYLKLIQHFEPSKALKIAESGIRKLNSELDVLDVLLKYCR
jgi:NTE family protein